MGETRVLADERAESTALFSASRRLAAAEQLGITCELLDGPTTLGDGGPAAAPAIERLRTPRDPVLLWSRTVESASVLGSMVEA